MIISGSLISRLTFPGVLVQAKIREKILGKDPTLDYKNLFLIVTIPFLVNSILCFLSAMLMLPLFKLGQNGNIMQGLLGLGILWLSISFGMHAFPYKNDAEQFWSLGKKAIKSKNALGVIGFPLAAIIYIINVLRFFWIDAIYAIFIIWISWYSFGMYENTMDNTVNNTVNSRSMCLNENIDVCIKILEDKHSPDRSLAMAVLGKMKDNRAVEPLIQTLKDDNDYIVRGAAARALGDIGDERAVEPLIQALNDESIAVRAYAARALGEIGDRRAIEPLIQASMDKNSDVQSAAEDALKNFGIGKTPIPIPQYTQISKNNSISNEEKIYVNISQPKIYVNVSEPKIYVNISQ